MTVHSTKRLATTALTACTVLSTSTVVLASCGFFERSSKEQRERVQAPKDETKNEGTDDLNLEGSAQNEETGGATATPTPEPIPEKTAEPGPGGGEPALVFSDVESILVSNCEWCHANGSGPKIQGFEDYTQLKAKVLDRLTTSDLERIMPPYGNTAWRETADGQILIKYFQQEGELRP